MRWLLWLLLAMPLIELWFIIRVGSSIGGLATIALLLGAGILGMNLLRLQGFNTLTKLDQRLQRGELPAVEILESFALSFAAFLLIIPGFITDLLAIPLLIPPLRRWLVRRFLSTGFYTQRYTSHQNTSPHAPYRYDSDIIEGEYRREDDSRLR
jgi:UPF0716 protein FxsA